ncbi:unnamed protein product [Gadus morhua 'NCC']
MEEEWGLRCSITPVPAAGSEHRQGQGIHGSKLSSGTQRQVDPVERDQRTDHRHGPEPGRWPSSPVERTAVQRATAQTSGSRPHSVADTPRFYTESFIRRRHPYVPKHPRYIRRSSQEKLTSQ